MDISELIIEVTRKCNMACGHCLRGCSQNVDINNQYITDVLEKIDNISSITFTGGEPMLNVPAITHFIKECKRLRITVGYFYIATNGKEMTDEFMKVILDLYLFCDWKESCCVEISNDYYHDVEGQDSEAKGKLMAFKFGGIRSRREHETMLYEGSFKDVGNDNGNYTSADGYRFDNGNIVGLIYINALGNLIDGCDWSYESQEKEELIVCKSSEFSLEKFKEYAKEVEPCEV